MSQPTQVASKGLSAPTEDRAIRCADCLHCQQFREFARSGRYILKVRCARGHWRRGKDRRLVVTYDLHTLLARRMPACPDYESLSEDGDERERYLADLRASLPIERHIYNADGTFADGKEGFPWDATT